MAVAAGRVRYGERLSVVDPLQELRTRIIVSLAAIALAFGLTFWQNHSLLHIINRPLSHQTERQVRSGDGPLGATYSVQQSARSLGDDLAVVVGALERPKSGASAQARATLAGVAPRLQRTITRLSAPPSGEKPVTLGIGEPFTTTVGIALLFALVLALPLLLYQAYSFALPAFRP